MQTVAASVALRTREVVHRHYRITSLIRVRRRAILFTKHQIDGQSDGKMKFFTPELYLRFNSPDDEVADRANQDWEAAIEAYQRRLNHLGDRLPQHVQKLSELCLHDWELLAWNDVVEPDARLTGASSPVWSAFSVLSLRRESEIISLNYVLRDKVRRCSTRIEWPFTDSPTYWLYDEVDVASAKAEDYVHRILFSDGTTACIPFAIVFMHRISWQPRLSAAI